MKYSTVLALTFSAASHAFLPRPMVRSSVIILRDGSDPVISPFDESQQNGSVATASNAPSEGPLDLTWENVEMVLDEMRPYLIQDGGNVVIADIDGPVVRLELQVSHTNQVQIRCCLVI